MGYQILGGVSEPGPVLTHHVTTQHSEHLRSATLDDGNACQLCRPQVTEQDFGAVRTRRIAAWRAGTPVDAEQLLAMVASVGKGRLGARLAKKAVGLPPPAYIENAITTVVARVSNA